jgi:beta-glucosidase
LTAVLEGAYHPAYLQAEGANAPVFTAEDMAAIGGKIDFLGMNMYAPHYIRAAPETPSGWAAVPPPSSYPKMNMDWLLMGPPITYWGPRWASEIWQVPEIVISENGCSSNDTVAADGEVYDTDRLMYVREHLIHAQRAVREGYPLNGYFWWSLMDNYEWAEGYSKRFGFTFVDYTTLKRTLKLSGKFYRETIARGGVQ